MSDRGDIHKLAFPGVLSALLVLGSGSIPGMAQAESLRGAASSLVLSKHHLAQASNPDGEAPSQATPAEVGQEIDDDVPFSELNEALTAARSRLNELTKAAEIAKVAGELREKLQAAEAENAQLKSVLGQLQTDFGGLQATKQEADVRIQELQAASEEAAAEAARLNEELVSVRWQNSQLTSSLSQTEAAAEESAGALQTLQNEFAAREESLTAAADVSAGEITRLQRELDTAQNQLLTTENQQAKSSTELVELRQIVDETTEESARLAQDLDGTITELANARTQLAETEGALQEAQLALNSNLQETEVLREQLTSNRSENEELRRQLQSAQIDLEQSRSLASGLEQQVELLKAAAGEATNAARQNLLAVEGQINEINAALASVKADDLLAESDRQPAAPQDTVSTATATGGSGSVDSQSWVPRPSPPRSGGDEGGNIIAVTATDGLDVGPPSTQSQPVEPLNGAASPVTADAGEDQGLAINLASLTTDLPANQRDDAAALLSQLKATQSQRGLSMTVPGELLFAVDSEQIEPAAFEPLANVAELVNLYDERSVVIVGHTDAVGDASYNQLLSERRAALVKQFFVDNFQISEDRLQIEGKGEQDPIESNATADGRNANRRVEVVILN